MALAQIYGLRIPIVGLDSRQFRRLAAAAPLIKANFNPDEPRVPAGQPSGGEWAEDGGRGDEAPPLVAPVAASVAGAAEIATSVFGAVGRTVLEGLADLAAGMAGPTAFLGVLFLPANRSPVAAGPLPGRPDLSYRYDQDTGVLQIYRQSDDGQEAAVSGHLGTDGRFYDENGPVIGRDIGGTALVDPGALQLPVGQTAEQAGAAATSAENRPQLCPSPSEEDIAGRSERTIAYQTQITGLPPGLEVKLNGVRFDGCREADGTMLEAKGPGYADKMEGTESWQDWFTGSEGIEAQMQGQARARRRPHDGVAFRRAAGSRFLPKMGRG